MRITRTITLTGIFGHAFDYFDRNVREKQAQRMHFVTNT